jgi:fido (protein-threonine AMPylation protein)
MEERLQQVEREVSELEGDSSGETEALLNYYKKWRRNNERYRLVMAEVKSRQFVINSLGYRGYGVNRDLLKALEFLTDRYGGLEGALAERFYRKTKTLEGHFPLTGEIADERRSDRIISELARRLGRTPGGEMQRPGQEAPLDLDHYFRVMSRETSWQANTAIFQKMFFSVGASSMTIMKGSAGLHDRRSCRELKLLANRNFVDTGRELFSALQDFTEIDIDLLKRIHARLSRDVDADGGNFRTIDFPDRNGVTFEFANFPREMADLAVVLDETAHSFHRLHTFIYNLARSYYMFIAIHPFWDGNGRAGRCFLNFLFMKKGLPPVVPDDRGEVSALPRYGGSMEDMHHYLKRRLQRAIGTYFYERWKLDAFGLLHKRLYHAAFDSGFYFRQIEGTPARIEVNFEAYVCDDPRLREILADQCKVAFPDDSLLYDMTVYCGFCSGPFAEWRLPFSLKDFYRKEVASDIPGVRAFDVDFVADIPAPARRGEYFSCSVASGKAGLIFNNKGLNYSYRLDL